jgi:hypothetical protein
MRSCRLKGRSCCNGRSCYNVLLLLLEQSFSFWMLCVRCSFPFIPAVFQDIGSLAAACLLCKWKYSGWRTERLDVHQTLNLLTNANTLILRHDQQSIGALPGRGRQGSSHWHPRGVLFAGGLKHPLASTRFCCPPFNDCGIAASHQCDNCWLLLFRKLTALTTSAVSVRCCGSVRCSAVFLCDALFRTMLFLYDALFRTMLCFCTMLFSVQCCCCTMLFSVRCCFSVRCSFPYNAVAVRCSFPCNAVSVRCSFPYDAVFLYDALFRTMLLLYDALFRTMLFFCTMLFSVQCCCCTLLFSVQCCFCTMLFSVRCCVFVRCSFPYNAVAVRCSFPYDAVAVRCSFPCNAVSVRCWSTVSKGLSCRNALLFHQSSRDIFLSHLPCHLQRALVLIALLFSSEQSRFLSFSFFRAMLFPCNAFSLQCWSVSTISKGLSFRSRSCFHQNSRDFFLSLFPCYAFSMQCFFCTMLECVYHLQRALVPIALLFSPEQSRFLLQMALLPRRVPVLQDSLPC